MQVYTGNHSAWAWLILFNAFVCTAVVDGICFTFGLHLLEIMQDPEFDLRYQGPPSFMLYLLPGALLTGGHLYASPLANTLVNYFDYRPVAIASACVTGSIFMASAFLSELEDFAPFFGICGGISCGLLYFPSLSIVAQWFEARRAFAVGLTICGSGVGTCLMSVFMRPAVGHYTWRGFLIILGAVFFQISVGIAFFRPVEVQQVIDIVSTQREMERRRKLIERKRILALKSRKSNRNASSAHRRVPIPLGTIMARIVEEKYRQRNSSTGSLDGMVITRDNQLISIPSEIDREYAKAAAAIYALQSAPQPSYSSHPSEPETNPVSQVTTDNQLPLLLAPPQNFSKSGMIRIAGAILQKLEAQAVIAPGMGCPNMSDCFRKFSATYQAAPIRAVYSHAGITSEDLEGSSASGAPLDYSGVCSKFPDKQKSFSSEKISVKIIPSLRVNGVREQAISGVLSSNPHFLKTKDLKQVPETASQLSSLSSIDPKTDKAIARELSCVYLDSTVKARIHSYIRQELHRVGLTVQHDPASVNQEASQTGDQQIKNDPDYSCTSLDAPCRSMENCSLHKEVDHSAGDAVSRGVNVAEARRWSPSVRRNVVPGDRPLKSTPSTVFTFICALATYLREKLDLPLLTSPSFLLLSLACTLHMSAFFAPIHLLPLFLALEGDRPPCGRSVRWRLDQFIIKTPGPFANVIHILVAIGVSHLIGRLIATFYIERSLNGPQFKLKRQCSRLVDPVVLNLLTLFVSSVTAALIPLSVKTICFPSLSSGECGCFKPPVAVLYAVTCIHTLASAISISMRSVVAVEFLSVHILSHAFSYLLVFQGTGAILGLLLLGKFSEAVTGVKITANLLEPNSLLASHALNPLEPAYYMTALIFFLSLLSFSTLRIVSNWEARRYASKRASMEADHQRFLKVTSLTTVKPEMRLTAPACIVTGVGGSSDESGVVTDWPMKNSDLLLTADELYRNFRLRSELLLEHADATNIDATIEAAIMEHEEAPDKGDERLLPIQAVPASKCPDERVPKISSCSKDSDQSYITFLMPRVAAHQ